MLKTNISLPQKHNETSPKTRSSKSRKKASKPKINIVLDKEEVVKMIRRIKKEADYHHSFVTELRAKMEKLSQAAFEELLKVKELRGIVENLEKNGDGKLSTQGLPDDPEREEAPAGGNNQIGQEKNPMDLEMEKLLFIKKWLEEPVASRSEMETPAAGTAAMLPAKKKILVVDDDLTTVKILTHFLERENYAVRSSLSGAEGLEKTFQEKPALILLDIMIPDLNGFQFLSLLRKNKDFSSVPVILLSMLSEESKILQGLEVGAVDYITKPFSPPILLAKIKKHLSLEK